MFFSVINPVELDLASTTTLSNQKDLTMEDI